MFSILTLDNGTWKAVLTTCNLTVHDEDKFMGLDDNLWVRVWSDKRHAEAYALRKYMRNFRVVPLYIAERLNGEEVSCFA